MGASINVLTGYLISRVKVRILVVTSAIVTMIASPIMATIDVHESYWRAAFWAMLLSPVNPDGTLAILLTPNIRKHWSVADGILSAIHRLKSRHLQCVPPRRPIACWRRVQRGRSVRQLRWLGRHGCHRGISGRSFHVKPYRCSFERLPSSFLDDLCCNVNCNCDNLFWAQKEWTCRQERRVRRHADI